MWLDLEGTVEGVFHRGGSLGWGLRHGSGCRTCAASACCSWLVWPQAGCLPASLSPPGYCCPVVLCAAEEALWKVNTYRKMKVQLPWAWCNRGSWPPAEMPVVSCRSRCYGGVKGYLWARKQVMSVLLSSDSPFKTSQQWLLTRIFCS